MKPSLVIFASGSGTNAENIIRYFQKNGKAEVLRIYCNNPKAAVIARAQQLGVPVRVFDRKDWTSPLAILNELEKDNPSLLVLAGFLWLVPEEIIRAFSGKIINIHPALLPAFGGKGYYGIKVHEAVIDSGAIISGISIHQVNEHFDEGEILFQAACHVDASDTPASLAAKIHELEQRYFPVVLEKLLQGGS